MLPETQTYSRGHFAIYYDKFHNFFCTSIQKLQHNICLCKQLWTEASVKNKKHKGNSTGYTKEWINYRVHVKRCPRHLLSPVTLLAEKRGRQFQAAG